MSWWSTLGPSLIGAGTQLVGGYLNQRAAENQNALDRQLARDRSGSRGWSAVEPLLQSAIPEIQRVYQQRLNQGNYSQNVRRPRNIPGASSGQRQLANRARELALGGPSSTVTVGQSYISDLLSGSGAPGTGSDFLQQAGSAFAGIPSGSGANLFGDASRMYGRSADLFGQAFNTAATGSNQYLDPLFGIASGLLDGGGYSIYGSGGGFSGLSPHAYDINLDDQRFTVNPGDYDIDTTDPRLRIDPTGGQIGPADPLNSQKYVSEMLLSGNAPVGSAQYISEILDDPFATSNPHLEDIIRLQQEDLERSHLSDLGRLNEAAANVSGLGGSDFQLARSQMASELGRNIERAGTATRYDDYNQRLADRMEALGMGQQMDLTALAQAANLEIAHRADLTDREKADLSARVSRELANQGTLADLLQANQATGAGLAAGNRDLAGLLARSNQGTQADLAATGASLSTQRSIAAADAAARNRQAALQALLGVAGLQNESQLGRLGAMGSFAGGIGNVANGIGQLGAGLGALELGSAQGLGDVGSSLGNLELGALSQIPGLEGIEMGQLGQAFGLESSVAGANRSAARANAAAQAAYDQARLQWDYNRQANALSDLIQQGLAVGNFITTPTGLGNGSGVGGRGGFDLGGQLLNTGLDVASNYLFRGGGAVPSAAGGTGAVGTAPIASSLYGGAYTPAVGAPAPFSMGPLGDIVGSSAPWGSSAAGFGGVAPTQTISGGYVPGSLNPQPLAIPGGAPGAPSSGSGNGGAWSVGRGPGGYEFTYGNPQSQGIDSGLGDFFTWMSNPFSGEAGNRRMGSGTVDSNSGNSTMFPYNMWWVPA